MSSITRKLARKSTKAFTHDSNKATAKTAKARQSVCHATAQQIIRDHGVVSEAYDNLMILFDVAVHRCFGWGEKMRGRLHAKMARHLLCLKGRMVTTADIERILRDEAGLDLDKCHIKAEPWDHDRRLQYSATDDMSAIFLLSLMDEFGYKKVRLSRAYDTAANIAHEVKTGKAQWMALKSELVAA